MVVKLANGLVSAGQFDNYACPIAVDTEYSTTVLVDTLNCGKQLPKEIFVRQASAKTFTFTDTEEELDFGLATAITFGVWDSNSSGSTERISKSLGSGVTATGGNNILVSLSDDDTDIETPQTLWWELWATLSSEEINIARGKFTVQETRKNDV